MCMMIVKNLLKIKPLILNLCLPELLACVVLLLLFVRLFSHPSLPLSTSSKYQKRERHLIYMLAHFFWFYTGPVCLVHWAYLKIKLLIFLPNKEEIKNKQTKLLNKTIFGEHFFLLTISVVSHLQAVLQRCHFVGFKTDNNISRSQSAC